MNWTKLKTKYLFSLNVALLMGLILYKVRGDFTYHWTLLFWPLVCGIVPALRQAQESFFKALSYLNSRIILTLLFFLVITPFSFFYRLFYRHQSFKKVTSSFIKKETISEFSRPF